MKRVKTPGTQPPPKAGRKIPLPVLQLADIPQRFYAGRHPIEGSRFPTKVFRATRLELPLRPGDGNSKMGGRTLLVGRWRGVALYYVALEEGVTCSSECMYGQTGLCGAANYSGFRFVVDDGFYDWTEWQIGFLLRRHAAGLATRLYVSGDAPDERNVKFWASMLARYPKLRIFGHTHHTGPMQELILNELNFAYPERAVIRPSESDDAEHRAITVPSLDDLKGREGVPCPAMLTRTPDGVRAKRTGEPALSDCAHCGRCMDPRVRTIVWLLMVNGVGHPEREPKLE